MTRKKSCYYCGAPTTNRPDPVSAPVSPTTMEQCAYLSRGRPLIRRMASVCNCCRAQLGYVKSECKRLTDGEP